ncbi:MAG TPA: DUF308 domain-containing protein, partial [Promineifilum sp.]|nr:DUF308 domain-containing protein [Promineifilum sp.]
RMIDDEPVRRGRVYGRAARFARAPVTNLAGGNAMNGSVLDLMAQNWSFVLLRGIVAILFGVMAFAWPGITLAVFIMMFSASALVDGVLSIVAAVRGGTPMPRWSTGLAAGFT